MPIDEPEKPDRRLWFWRPLFHRNESAETKATRAKIFGALPRETVSDEYGTRPKYHQFIEDIFKRMPPDSRRLHPSEPRWQTLLAPKYIQNKRALSTFQARMLNTNAGKAYLYFPLGSDEPTVWFDDATRAPEEDKRYSVTEFEEKYGGDE